VTGQKFRYVVSSCKKSSYLCDLFKLTVLNQFTMLNHYETVFILTPVLSEAQMKEAVDKFKGVITAKGGTVINEENWGLRKLAYPIQKKSTGFFTMLEFTGPGDVIKTLEIEYKRDERIIRFLTTRLDKYASEYAEKRRNKKLAAQKVTEE